MRTDAVPVCVRLTASHGAGELFRLGVQPLDGVHFHQARADDDRGRGSADETKHGQRAS
ncbi:hypothetical protein [Streptomyces halobius]|uniref:Uncharacterized protein n=1 Tax=Streptomyces halobius TaxID=2879846 RepID=A0ABY4MI43_9ACTN|nr:hypothetical protein [Streptomyces halobius]UQA97475.1 hypothetical protein K9S39_41530 [Streptomyces halobius]